MDHYSPFCKKPPTPRKLSDYQLENRAKTSNGSRNHGNNYNCFPGKDEAL